MQLSTGTSALCGFSMCDCSAFTVWWLVPTGSQGKHPQRQEADSARAFRFRSEAWPAVFPSTARTKIQGRDELFKGTVELDPGSPGGGPGWDKAVDLCLMD